MGTQTNCTSIQSSRESPIQGWKQLVQGGWCWCCVWCLVLVLGPVLEIREARHIQPDAWGTSFQQTHDCRNFGQHSSVRFNTIQATDESTDATFFSPKIWSNLGEWGGSRWGHGPLRPRSPKAQLTGCNQNIWWGGPRYYPAHLCQKSLFWY